MKMTIRKGIFETNSSMTHSLVICTKEEMDKWENGELLYDNYRTGKLFSKDETKEMINAPGSRYDEEDFWTYEDFISNRGYYGLESDGGSFTTPSGDEMSWVAVYGSDG